MKLIVQIPCFNEEATLAQTVADIPRQIEGVPHVEVLVVDDGSTDRTVAVAREAGVEYIVCHSRNRGLAAAFLTGIESSLRLGADLIVNTDADNQYCGADFPRLIGPILRGEADSVVGDRQTDQVAHFGFVKRRLQWLGSVVVRMLSGTEVRDAVSGLRAIARDAAIELNVYSDFSYTIETLIQAGQRRQRMVSVPIRTNGPTRPSRLFRSLPQFLIRSGSTMVRSFRIGAETTVGFLANHWSEQPKKIPSP